MYQNIDYRETLFNTIWESCMASGATTIEIIGILRLCEDKLVSMAKSEVMQYEEQNAEQDRLLKNLHPPKEPPRFSVPNTDLPSHLQHNKEGEV